MTKLTKEEVDKAIKWIHAQENEPVTAENLEAYRQLIRNIVASIVPERGATISYTDAQDTFGHGWNRYSDTINKNLEELLG